jgi:6-phosphogluconolactonase/glucosamine-6-phosphate isomerase/deaminase
MSTITTINASDQVDSSRATINTNLDNLNRYDRSVASTATYTILATDDIVGVTYTATGAVTLTLPAISSAGKIMFVVKDEGANANTFNITINRAGSDTVDGGTSATISTDSGALTFYNDGTSAWFTY